MKRWMDNMLDKKGKKGEKGKKAGILEIVLAGVMIMAIGLLVSCGYKSEEPGGAEADTQNNSIAAESVETGPTFDYNNEYNEMLRYYEGDIYLAREDGIRRIEGGEGEEDVIYENLYGARRGMELYQNFLYFCGSMTKEGQESATIYRMDLNTFVVEDMLADFDAQFDILYSISIYENNLYVASGYGARIGFALNEAGEITGQLDDEADDFLYREYNDYMELEWQKLSSQTEDVYWEMVEETGKRYQAAIDVAACKKMLQGSQVVSQYKDELLRSLFLEKEDGTYEHLCDMAGYPYIVTETGIYYAANEAGDIWYVDYETKNARPFYEKAPDAWAEISLMNYDADYVYLLESRNIDTDTEGAPKMERDLIRIPRQGGEGEAVYRFEDELNSFGSQGVYMHCGVYGKHMYFREHETISFE